MHDEESVQAILESYSNKSIGNALRAGGERPNQHILTMIKVADFHAELAQRDFAGVRKHPKGVAKVMCLGIGRLLPEMMKANSADAGISLPAAEVEFQAVRTSLMETGQLLDLKTLAEAEEYKLVACRVCGPDEVEIRKVAASEEALEHRDRDALLDAEHNERSDNRKRIDKLFEQAWHARFAAGPAGDSQALAAFREAGRQYLEFFASEYAEADAFADGTEIGPLTFAQWKQIVVNVCSLAFAKAWLEEITLMEQRRFNPLGFLTLIPTQISDAELRECFRVPGVPEQPELFEKVKACLVLGEENAKLDYGPDGAIPCLVSLGDAVFAPRYSRLGNPYMFLVQRLAKIYSFQMRRILAERESEFQDEIATLLRSNHYLFGESNVKLLKEEQILTDIDLVVYERSTNCLYLIQLKWLAVYARELARREKQYDELLNKAGGWVQKVASWVGKVGPDNVLRTVGLGDDAIDPAKLTVRLLVLNRWWARFSGKEPFNAQAAWLSWSRLKLLAREVPSGSAPLDYIYLSAQSMPLPVFTPVTTPKPYTIADLTVNVYT
ncbi:hypothetical protein IM543_09055 [Massilia sp. UMI-21]|nr:hypothetical protein IM543_09055 [Massilia sp. UMI-21]